MTTTPAKRRPKYGNTKTVVDGITFDSKKEAKRYGELKLLVAAGEITNLTLQPKFILEANDTPLVYPSGRKAIYKGDFQYWDVRLNAWVIEDTKGYQTPEFKLKWAVMNAMGREVKLT